ncbi:MAG TPA: hypothetical protein VHN37_16105 [Actinomycetota bacterium]|nr:hypothetical protein [Actinomycetota bacterium]
MRKRIVVLLSCVALLGAACGGDGDGAEPEAGATVAAEDAPDEVTGVLLDVESESVGEVTSFTLKDGDDVYEIFIAEDVDYGFNLGHLNEHLTTGDPVHVPLEVRGDKLYALSIEDA